MEFIDSVYNNLIAGNAYITILNGLWVTVKISFWGLFLGTLLGALFCYLRMVKFRLINITVRFFIEILRGSPVLLLLMILYFVVFAQTRTSAVLIAILAFALNSGAHISEIFRSSLLAVDKKQAEAARMLGFSRLKAFWHITFPQAGVIAKPVLQSTMVNIIQWTSVVGYVAITDLTRTLNNVGARTGDPFFPLIFGIIIYLSLSYLVYALFGISKTKAPAL